MVLEDLGRYRGSKCACIGALLGLILALRFGPLHGEDAKAPPPGSSTDVGPGFGGSIAALGDVNGDGTPDFAVASKTGPFSESPGAGIVLIHSGKDATTLMRYQAATPDERYSVSIAGTGDLDKDGIGDLLVGSPFASTDEFKFAGVVRAISGKDGRSLWISRGPALNSRFGYAVALVGDVNKDGIPDAVVGACNLGNEKLGVGRAIVLSGKDGSTIWSTSSRKARDGFGTQVAGIRDISGDGIPDVLVGAPEYAMVPKAEIGHAYAYSGKDGTLLLTLDGATIGGEFGCSLAGLDDLDGDGTSDFAIGSNFTDSGSLRWAGETSVFSGESGKLLRTVHGDEAYLRSGYSIARAGDIDKDGVTDLIIGATRDVSGRDRVAGQVRVVSGKDGSTLAKYDGNQEHYGIGFNVLSLGDVNGDGCPDVIAGAERNHDCAGRAIVLSGRDGKVLFDLVPNKLR